MLLVHDLLTGWQIKFPSMSTTTKAGSGNGLESGLLPREKSPQLLNGYMFA